MKKKIKINLKHFLKGQNVILGISAGTQSLLPYCLINEDCEIITQGNFNFVNNVNYLQKYLNLFENYRFHRETWQEDVAIKDLIAGFSSAVIGEISEMIFTLLLAGATPIIVLERNTLKKQFFKNGRWYNKFIIDLVIKLNYLTNKNIKRGPGSIFQGFQLTPLYDKKSHQYISDIIEKGGQLGIIFIT